MSRLKRPPLPPTAFGSPDAPSFHLERVCSLKPDHSEVTRRAITIAMDPADAGPESLRKAQAEWRVWAALASLVPVKVRTVRPRTMTGLLKSVSKALETAVDLQDEFELMELVIRDLKQAQRSIDISKSVSKLLGRTPKRSLHFTSLVAVLKNPPAGLRPFSDNDLTKLKLASDSDWINPPCAIIVQDIKDKEKHPDVGPGGGAELATNSLRVMRQRRGVAARKKTPASSQG